MNVGYYMGIISIDDIDFVNLGKLYCKIYGYTYTEDELWALSEWLTFQNETYMDCGFEFKKFLQDNNLDIELGRRENYNKEEYIETECSGGYWIYEYIG